MEKASRKENFLFFLTIFLAGLCSLIYELLISTTSSYFLGDSVKQFSLTIGIYMASMGVGSYLSKYIQQNALEWFIKIEILLGLVGGASIPILYFIFDRLTTGQYQFTMLLITGIIGMLTGFEIPLLVRILKENYPLKSNLAYVLSLDYIGALVATLLFPFLLLPYLGTFRTSIAFGMINIGLGLMVYFFCTQQLSLVRQRKIVLAGFSCLLFFGALSFFSSKLLHHWEDTFFKSKIVFSKQTPYQQLTLTQNKSDLRLYINRIIQFSSSDEYRYHETLGLLPLHYAPYKKNILILGGGEGLLAREVLKYEEIESVTIVDLDGEVFRLAKENSQLKKLNENALLDPKVTPIEGDAMAFLMNSESLFDVIIADLPDPSNDALSRLYSVSFYRLVQNRLTPHGVFATQASSPFHTKNAFWCIYETMKSSGFEHVYPLHTYVPSFGDWGFIFASPLKLDTTQYNSSLTTKYLEPGIVSRSFEFPKDISNPSGLKINQLDQPNLLHYFLEDWERFRKEKTN